MPLSLSWALLPGWLLFAAAQSPGWSGNATERRLACIERAEAEIARAPDKDDWHVTTTHAFKRDVARFFCARGSERLVALEIGIFKGHSTSVYASVFRQVISVDVNPDFTVDAARHSERHRNVVFMALDSYLADWNFLRANRPDVAIIDGDHTYNKVIGDITTVADTFPTVRWFVFDDYNFIDVRRAVQEMEQAKVLVRCRPIGRGKDGSGWELKDYSSEPLPEGQLCERGPGSYDKKAAFVDMPYLAYPIKGGSTDLLARPEDTITFTKDGKIWTRSWGAGEWQDLTAEMGVDIMALKMPELVPKAEGGLWEASFNKGRTSFVLAPAGEEMGVYFCIRADKIQQLFKIENERFEGASA